MHFSYHGGHSGQFCCHAHDQLGQIVEAYVRAGFTHLAITEHQPARAGYLCPEEEALGAVQLAERFEGLMDVVRPELHARFDQALRLRVGFETEFYGPDPLREIGTLIDRYRPELIVASVHHVRGISIDDSAELSRQAESACGSGESLWAEYFDQQYELIAYLAHYTRTIPVVVGHMDVIKLFCGHDDPDALLSGVWDKVLRNIDAAVKGGLVFEVNARALKKGLHEPYPGRRILDAIKARRGTITMSDDSHGADEVGLHLSAACAFARATFQQATVVERTSDSYKWRQVPLPYPNDVPPEARGSKVRQTQAAKEVGQ